MYLQNTTEFGAKVDTVEQAKKLRILVWGEADFEQLTNTQ